MMIIQLVEYPAECLDGSEFIPMQRAHKNYQGTLFITAVFSQNSTDRQLLLRLFLLPLNRHYFDIFLIDHRI